MPLRVRVARLDRLAKCEHHRFSRLEVVGVPLQAHERANTREQLARVHRFCEEVVCAGLEAAHLVGGVAERRDQDDRDQSGGGVFLERAAGFVAVPSRHHDVHQHQVGLFARDEVERLVAVGRGKDDVAVARQLPRQQPHIRGLVINDDDASTRGAGLDRTARRVGRGCLLVAPRSCQCHVRGSPLSCDQDLDHIARTGGPVDGMTRPCNCVQSPSSIRTERGGRSKVPDCCQLT